MPKTLHILNGDCTLRQFRASGIEGDTFVWREVLSDGPTHSNFGSEPFWALRNSFMTETFGLAKDEYQTGLIIPFKEIQESLNSYQEVTLWFEYDLFCQINMIALIHWMGTLAFEGTASLICAGKSNSSDKLLGLGEIHHSQYTQLFASRLKLGSREYEFCSDVYNAYCSTDPNDLYNYILLNFSGFPYLPNALEAHLRRFPSLQTGLSEIETQLIELINSGETDKRKLVGKMLTWQTYHGFGDSQYFNCLNGMKPLFEDFDKLVLRPNLDKQAVEDLLKRDSLLGGAKLSDWYWDDYEKTLIPKESAS